MPKEIETKFKISDVEGLKVKLKAIGAEFLRSQFEADTYYMPNKPGSFNGVIRVRDLGDSGEFTLKYDGGGSDATYKVREELQIKIDSPEMLKIMMKTLGYRVKFMKEKKRDLYSYLGVTICVDTLPYIGTYIEIEADQDRIREVAEKLGLDMGKAMSDTYMSLFNLYKIVKNKPNIKLVFKSEPKE